MEKEVNLYVTSKSLDADKIKDYLTHEGVNYKVYDVNTDVGAHRRMLEATRGACSDPVIEVGNQIVCGFDRERLDAALAYELH